jgi:glycosyltransferase involved in cell wall biosynthesis
VAATDAPSRIADAAHPETHLRRHGLRLRAPAPSQSPPASEDTVSRQDTTCSPPLNDGAIGARDATANIGLVHDYLLVMRGAERSFAAIADCWRQAPIYTLLHDPQALDGHFVDREVHTSSLQRLGVGQAGFRKLLPLYPLAMARLDASVHEVIVSSSSAFAHGVKTHTDAKHICYCYTPFRYAWHEREKALAEVPRALRPLLGVTLAAVRTWDRAAAAKVRGYIAISKLSQQRIGEYYGREAPIVHPPVDVKRFAAEALGAREPEDWFLVVSELVAHKRIDVALEAARRLGAAIKVVGSGPEHETLRRHYGSSAEFLGRVDDRQLADLYGRTRALVMPGVEEFGIAAVEAQAAGRPVVATACGGACETVHDGKTGVLVAQATPDDFAQALHDTDFDAFSAEHIRTHASRFSVENFQRRFRAQVERMIAAPAPA